MKLPARVHDVLRAAMTGLDVKDTAATLKLSVNTVKMYRRILCERFSVSRMSEVVRGLLVGRLGGRAA